MALRLGTLVVCGEIINTRRNSVHGWLGLRGSERPMVLQLTGTCGPDLAGRHIRFEVREQGEDGSEEERDLSMVAWQQIGPTGVMTAARKVRVADCSPEELYIRSKLGEPPPTQWKRCLYLEWFSQDGRVVLELVDPIIEFVDSDEAEDEGASEELPLAPEHLEEESDATGLGVTSVRIDDEGNVEVNDVRLPVAGPDEIADDARDAAYVAIPEELQRQLDREAFEVDWALEAEDGKSDVIRECELIDELIQRDGEPVGSIFDRRDKLPSPDDLDDKEVARVFKSVLAELALCHIALDMCEHFTPREAYRLLLDEIFKEPSLHPELRRTQWVQHFMTSEYCKECEAEMDREFEEYERRRRENPEQMSEDENASS